MINKKISINNRLWKKNDKYETEWHEKQYHHLKQISIEFEEFINKQLKLSSNIIDLGGGSGSTTAYLANLHPDKKFTVFDINKNLINIGKKYSKDIKNLTFQQGNFFNLKKKRYDGVISHQTLSWLPDFQTLFLEIIKKIKPNFIALSSLFYEGDIDFTIKVKENIRNRESFYNTYSIPRIKRFLKKHKYYIYKKLPFSVNFNIQEPKNKNFLQTYTKIIKCKKNANPFLSCSGVILMNWYFIIIKKK